MEKKFFITRVTYKESRAAAEPFIEAHRAFLDKHVQSGDIIASGGVQDKSGGFILSKHYFYQDTEKMLQHDPFFIADVAYYEIFEWEANRGMPKFFECIL